MDRRNAIKAIGASLLMPSALLADEKSLSIGNDVPKLIEEARKSLVMLFGKRGGQTVSVCSGVKIDGYVVTAGHCLEGGVTNEIADKENFMFNVSHPMGKAHKSKTADVGVIESDYNVPSLEIYEGKLKKGDEVYIVEPEGLRFLNPVEKDGEESLMGRDGYPTVKTIVEEVEGNRIQLEHYTIHGSSGTSVLINVDGKMKLAGIYVAFNYAPRIEEGLYVNDTDGIAVKIEEVKKLIHSIQP